MKKFFLAFLAFLAVQRLYAEDEVLDYMVNAVAAMSLKDTDTAVKNLQLALSRKPSDPRIHLLLGDALSEGGRASEALVSYQWAAYLSHEDPDFHNKVGDKISGLLGPAPEAPPEPGGVMALFDDRPAHGLTIKSSSDRGKFGPDFAYRAFGTSSLRLESLDRESQEIRFDLKDLLTQAPLAARKRFLKALESGGLQFWLRAEGPAANLDLWFEFQYPSWEEARMDLSEDLKSGLPSATALSPFTETVDGPVLESLTLGTQKYVVPHSEFQVVLIPLADFEGTGQNLPWTRLRNLVIRVPTSLHGKAYYLDSIRLIWDFQAKRVEDLKLRRDAAVALARPQDPAAWILKDGLREEFALFETDCQAIPASFTPNVGSGPPPLPGASGVPPGGTPQGPVSVSLPSPFLRPNQSSPQAKEEAARRASKLGLKGVDVAAVDPKNWSFLILDENVLFDGKRSLKVVADPHEGIGAFIPLPETDLSLIWPTGCLHFMVKGLNGEEDFDVALYSRRAEAAPSLRGQPIGRWIDHVTTEWQHVVIPLADFGDRSSYGKFGWDRFTGISFKSCPRSALENTFWIDEIWLGSCAKDPLPASGPEVPLRAGGPAPALKVEVSFRYTLPSDLAFDSGKAEFKAEGSKELLKWAVLVRSKYPGSGLVLTGHTDSAAVSKDSKFKNNVDLSLARAEAVKAFLITSAGFGEEEIRVSGRGEAEPVEVNTSPEGRAKNRRVEVLVTGKAKQQIEEVAEEGDRLLALGLYKEAWQRYIKIAEVAYQDPQIWYRLAITADRAGDADKAQEALNRMRMLLGK